MPRSYGVRPVRPSSKEVAQPLNMAALKAALGVEARRLGFAACGVTSMRPVHRCADSSARRDRCRTHGRDALVHARSRCRRQPTSAAVTRGLGRSSPWPGRTGPRPGAAAEPGHCTGASVGDSPPTRAPRTATVAVDYHDLLARRCDALVDWLRKRVQGGVKPSVSSIMAGHSIAPSRSAQASDSRGSTRR